MKILKNTKIQTVALLGVILVLIVPYIGACFYTFPAADDYAAALEYQAYVQEHGPSLFNPVKAAAYKAMNGGLNFISAVHYLLCPMLNGGLSAIRAWIFVSLLLFIASLVYLAATLCRYFLKGCTIPKVLFLSAVFLLLFFGLYNYAEVVFWYTCAISYELTLGAICLSGALLLDYVWKGGWPRLALSVFLAIFASLSATNIGTLCCFILLLIPLWGLCAKKAKPVVFLPPCWLRCSTCFCRACGRVPAEYR